jgi:hypothetical protein
MAYKTDVELKTQVDAVIVVNGNREITPPLDNSIRTNFIDSKINKALTDTYIFVGNGSNLAVGVAMSGQASISNAGVVTLLNSAVISKVITGYTSGAGTVAATDTILQAIQKLNGNTVANDSLVVHLAGTETITGAKTFSSDIKIDSDVYFLDTTYKKSIEVGVSNDLRFAEGFETAAMLPINQLIVGSGGYYAHFNSAAGYVNFVSGGSVDITAAGNITASGDDVTFTATDRVNFTAPTAMTFIASDIRWRTNAVTEGLNWSQSLLTDIRTITFQDKDITIAGINNETFTGTTNLGASIFSLPPVVPTYIVSGVPSAATYARGIIYVSDETGGAVLAFSDGANWRRVTDRAIIS